MARIEASGDEGHLEREGGREENGLEQMGARAGSRVR